MSNKSKGNKRERQAQKIMEEAGWTVEKPVNTQYSKNKDFFHLFDRIAVKKGEPVVFIQVKSNRASGITKWAKDVDDLLGLDNPACRYYYFVPYDYEGWRIIEVKKNGRTDVVDERKVSCDMGEQTCKFFKNTD